MNHPRLLLFHTDQRSIALLTLMLHPLKLEVDETTEISSVAQRLDRGPSLLLAAVRPSAPNALELLVHTRRKHPEIPVVLLFSAPDARRADEALRLGAANVLNDPCPAGVLRDVVADLLRPAERPAPSRPRSVAPSGASARTGVVSAPAAPCAASGTQRDDAKAADASHQWTPAEVVTIPTRRPLDGDETRPRDDRPPVALKPLKEALEVSERQILLKTLRALRWKRREAARVLEIDRTTLYKKMQKYGILSDDPESED